MSEMARELAEAICDSAVQWVNGSMRDKAIERWTERIANNEAEVRLEVYEQIARQFENLSWYLHSNQEAADAVRAVAAHEAESQRLAKLRAATEAKKC